MAQERGSDVRGAGADLTAASGHGVAPGPDPARESSPEPAGPVHVVFNPAAGRGRGGRRLAAYLELLHRHVPGFRHSVTSRPGEEADLADRALEAGAGTVVAAGGDGTWSHVADRVLRAGRPGVRFGILPAGTGNDFARSLGIDLRDPEEAVRVLARGRVRRIDVGRITSPGVHDRIRHDPRAPSGPRHFLNLVGFGFDVAVIDATARARFLRGELLYKLTALQQLFRFRGVDLELARDASASSLKGRHLMLTVSNGSYFGGGFRIAPGATLMDGALHACAISDASALRRADLFSKAGKGRHVEAPEVTLLADRAFRVRFASPPRYEVDGDVFVSRTDCVEIEVIPGALPLLTP